MAVLADPIEFRAWPKTPRLNRQMTISEKLDGGNGAIGIVELPHDDGTGVLVPDEVFHVVQLMDLTVDPPDTVRYYGVYAQSRNRLIRPGKTTDNYGFAQWVSDNAGLLVPELGPGLHFGEWWGNGIQRGYGLPEGDKRFSLFNTNRYGSIEFHTPGLGVVPVLYQGPFDTAVAGIVLAALEADGSEAVPGYMFPEGIMIYHVAAQSCFKVTVKDDDQPKSQGKIR